MTKNTRWIIIVGLSAGLLSGLTGCCRLWWRPGCAPRIITHPQSQLVKKGDMVSFSVATAPSTNVYYQWQFNGVNIAGATNSTLTISSADFPDVGGYRVLVWASPTNRSHTAYLSVYSTTGSGGTLSTPIGNFSGGGAPCSAAFNKAYTPHDAATGAIFLFYGPNATPQSGPFVNSSRSTKLTIDTFACENAPADTGIMIQNNFAPPPPNPSPNCNDNSPSAPACHTTGAKLGPITLSSNSGGIAMKNTYRVTVLYKNPPTPTGGTVTFNWLYHN